MKEINITKAVKNDDETVIAKIDAAIKEAEGKSKERTINAIEVINAVEKITNYLNIPKKYLDGVSFRYNFHADRFQNVYNYVPKATIFCIEFRKNSIYLVEVFRGNANDGHRADIKLTDAAKEEVIKNAEMIRI